MAQIASIQTRKTLPELSVESKLLEERLGQLAIDEFCSYQELSDLVGRDIQEEGRGNLRTAINRLLISRGMVIKAVRNEGVKRINDAANIAAGNFVALKIRKAVARRRRELHAVDYPALSREQQTSHNAQLSTLGVIRQFATEKVLKRIEEAVEKSELPVAKTIDFFKKKK